MYIHRLHPSTDITSCTIESAGLSPGCMRIRMHAYDWRIMKSASRRPKGNMQHMPRKLALEPGGFGPVTETDVCLTMTSWFAAAGPNTKRGCSVVKKKSFRLVRQRRNQRFCCMLINGFAAEWCWRSGESSHGKRFACGRQTKFRAPQLFVAQVSDRSNRGKYRQSGNKPDALGFDEG
jgi:hypothetical protein